MIALRKDKKNDRSYKFGRWLLILLAIASIPLDGQKMYEEIKKSESYLNKSLYDTVNFYSATISIHFIGLASALEHEMWLTVVCRLVSAFIYQLELNSRTNETLPEDPEEMRKVLHEKYPHKYPYKMQPGKKTNQFDRHTTTGYQQAGAQKGKSNYKISKTQKSTKARPSNINLKSHRKHPDGSK